MDARANTGDDEKLRLRRFALFFIFAFLDERLASEVSEKATLNFKSKKNEYGSSRDMVAICFAQWQANKKRMARGKPDFSLNSFGSMPEGVEPAAWLRFHKDASEDEMLAILFTRILDFSETETAETLKISLGTLRHRVGKGIRILGEHVDSAI